MNADERQRADALLERLLGLEAGERAAVLAEQRQVDPAVCDEVESLLAQEGAAILGGLLENPPAVPLAALIGEPCLPLDHNGRFGNYEIEGEVGRGGVGVVYRARHDRLRRTVALKMLVAGAYASRQEQQRFLREARSLAHLQHPNIVQVFEIGEHEKLPYLSLEFVSGGTLREKLAGQPQPHRASAELVATLASAVHYAHERGVLHRDLKPGNVLLAKDDSAVASAFQAPASLAQQITLHDGKTSRSKNGRDATLPSAIYGIPKIADFGLAKVMGEDHEPTATGSILGTASYMAPEQAAGARDIGREADIYALGAILYEMLTGRPPFRGTTSIETLDLVRTTDAPAPHLLAPGVPRDLETICLKCLERDAKRRYGTAEELALDLQRWLNGEPILARPTGRVVRAWKWTLRHPTWATLVAVTVLLPVAMILQGWWFVLRGQEALARRERELNVKSELEKNRLAEQKKELSEQHDILLQRQGLDEARRRFSRYDALNSLGRIPPARRGFEFDLLEHQVGRARRESAEWLADHDWGVVACLFDRDRTQFVSSGIDGCVTARWLDGRAALPLERGIWSEALRLWRPAIWCLRPDLPREQPLPDCFLRLCWLQEGKVVAGGSLRGEAVLWHLNGGRRERLFTHDRMLTALAASPDGEMLVFGDDQGTLIYRQTPDGPWRRMSLGSSTVFNIEWLRDVTFVVGHEHGPVRTIDLASEQVLSTTSTIDSVWDLDVRPDRNEIAVAGNDGTIALVPIDRVTSVMGHPSMVTLEHPIDDGFPPAVHALRYAPDGKQLAAGVETGQTHIVNIPSGAVVHTNRATPMALELARLPLFPPSMRRRFASLDFAQDGTSLFVSGLDSAIRRNVRVKAARDTTTEFRVGSDPRVQFDPVDAELLWAGTAEGRIELWDSRTGTLRTSIAAHDGRVTDLKVVKSGPHDATVVTASADGRLSFWKRSGDQIALVDSLVHPQSSGAFPVLPVLSSMWSTVHMTGPRRYHSVAISPDGRGIAAYDSGDWVSLFDMKTRQLLRCTLVRKSPSEITVSELVAFNRDGTRLAVAGHGQYFFLLDGVSLDLVFESTGTPFAGDGGTAMAWDESDPESLWGGDTQGSLRWYPPTSIVRDCPRLEAPIVGIASWKGGKRIAVGAANGLVQITDPSWGYAHALRSPYAHRNAWNATGLLFDPTGTRLAMTHGDGQIVIWETRHQSLPPLEDVQWKSIASLAKGDWKGPVKMNSQAFCLDARGNVCFLYSRVQSNSADSARPSERVVVFARQQGVGFHEIILRAAIDSDRLQNSHKRSMVLLRDRDTIWAAYRQPLNPQSEVGQVFLVRLPADPSREFAGAAERELVLEEEHGGFDLRLLPSEGSKPAIVHFSHNRHRLWLRTWQRDRWNSRQLGETGVDLRSVLVPDKLWHIAQGFSRFPRDPRPGMYWQYHPTTGEETAREVTHPQRNGPPLSLVLTPDKRPIAMFQTGDLEVEVVIAERTAPSQWNRRIIASSRDLGCWNMCIDRKGKLFVPIAHTMAGETQIYLAAGSGDDWTRSLVHRGPEGMGAIAIMGNDDLPRVVVFDPGEAPGDEWLRVYQPER